PRSPRSGGLRPPWAAPARPEHRLVAASQQSLQACIASLPLQSSLMSKTYLKSDHFSGGGSPQILDQCHSADRLNKLAPISQSTPTIHSPIKDTGPLLKQLLGQIEIFPPKKVLVHRDHYHPRYQRSRFIGASKLWNVIAKD